jgi:hypothetical protein
MAKTKRKKPGPAPTGIGLQIVVRMHPPMLKRLDREIDRRWKREDVTRPEAVRRLLDRAMARA